MHESGLIASNPNVMMAIPSLAETRITIELILERFAAGHTEDETLLAYPHITKEAIQAAVEFEPEALQASAVDPLERVAS